VCSDRVTRALLTSALWAPFLPSIASGDPIFFSFSREAIASSLRQVGIEANDHVQLIGFMAGELMEVSEAEVELRKEAFEPDESGFTPVIILAAQQVLAVEEMVNEPGGYSDHAYFPRLRKMISPLLPTISANPFRFDEFSKIWRVLAAEIRSIEGSTEASLTFRFGEAFGANKAKAFPLSQALLTREDLYSIVRGMSHELACSLRPNELWNEIRNQSGSLGRRAQRLLAITFLRPRIVQQVSSFARTVPKARFEASLRTTEVPEEACLGIFKESIDWLTDEFRAFLVEEGKFDRVEDPSQTLSYVRDLLRVTPVVYIPLGEFGDCWQRSTKTVPLDTGARFLALSANADTSTTSDDPLFWKDCAELVSEGKLAGYEDCEITEYRIKDGPRKDLAIYADAICVNESDSLPAYRWMGGVCVNARSRLYLRNALPTSICFEEIEFRIDELIAINGHPLTMPAFRQMLSIEDVDASYEIEFPRGFRARLAVAIRRHAAIDRVGYPLRSSGTISLFVERLRPEVQALIGFDESSLRLKPLMTQVESMSIITRLFTQWPSGLNTAEVLELEAAIARAHAPVPAGTRAMAQGIIQAARRKIEGADDGGAVCRT
jgi:hypothetical protein